MAAAVFAATMFTASASSAQTSARSCEETHEACLQGQTGFGYCRNTMQSTSDQRGRCQEACDGVLRACVQKRAAYERALAEVERTGGPKPGYCPPGWMLEASKTSKLGSFKCFASARDKPPADFTCPPGLAMVPGTGMIHCTAPDK